MDVLSPSPPGSHHPRLSVRSKGQIRLRHRFFHAIVPMIPVPPANVKGDFPDVCPGSSAHCRGNLPDFQLSIREIPTPVCGPVRNDSYWGDFFDAHCSVFPFRRGFVLSGLTKIGKGSIIRKKHLSASGAGWARGENRESGEKPGRYRHCKREDPAQGENRSLGAFPPRRPGRIVRRASQETCSNG